MTAALVRLMTSSRARTARACRRRHYLRYILGYTTAQDAHALRFGSLLHLALEAWWRAAMAGLPLEDWLAAAQAALGKQKVELLDLLKLRVLLTGYHLRWGEEAREFYEVLGVELGFEGPLRNPLTGKTSRNWKLAGKVDVLVRDRRDGRKLLIEHKSSSEDVSPGSPYWRRLRMDGQVSVYFEGARILGHDVDACLYDVVGKLAHQFSAVPKVDEHQNPIVLNAAGERVRTRDGKWRRTGDNVQGFTLQTRPETAEEFTERIAGVLISEPNRFFSRAEVIRLEKDMADALTDVWQLAQSLREEELVERYPRNPDACQQPGRECPYFDACSGVASLDDPRRFIKTDNVHPELAAA